VKLEQQIFDPAKAEGWRICSGSVSGIKPQLVLVFGDRLLLEKGTGLDEIRKLYPGAQVLAGSTSGEITSTEVSEGRLVATAIQLEKSRVACASARIDAVAESYHAGSELARRLSGPELAHVFVVSDGQRVNGTELARGFNEHLPPGARLSGGLAGDGARFERTVVGLDETPAPGRIVAVGFYGSALRFGSGSAGGWHEFGPERQVTRAANNTLFELDGQPALHLYKRYLGDQAANLPGSALRFPLSVKPRDADHPVVRTILSIDEKSEGMTFAGDIPEGASVRFMRASYEDLIDGAGQAADQTLTNAPAELALCVSCVGRRIVLGQRTEEETENVRSVVGAQAMLAGFYSYGELAPAGGAAACQLHNQTMTITTLREE